MTTRQLIISGFPPHCPVYVYCQRLCDCSPRATIQYKINWIVFVLWL